MNKNVQCDVREISRAIDDSLIGTMDKTDPEVGHSLIGSAACGDGIALYIRVHKGIVVDAKMKIFGCASAMSAAELMVKKLLNKPLEDAKKIKDTEIAEELNLLPIKFHCSVLAEAAIEAAIQSYHEKQKILDKSLGIS